jgi:hypothetical protein
VLLFCCAQALKVVYNYSFHAHVQIFRGSEESIIMCPVKHPEKVKKIVMDNEIFLNLNNKRLGSSGCIVLFVMQKLQIWSVSSFHAHVHGLLGLGESSCVL